jgi:hypothetical protein
MSTNRRTIRRGGKQGRITPEAIAAWQAADFTALHRALGLKPWEPSPLPAEITALGCSQDEGPIGDSTRFWNGALPKAQALQRQLLEVAGWPDCREAYKENLRRAREMASYYRAMVKHPERRHQGTGSDELSLRRKLKEEEREVRYRQRLLRELKDVQEEYRPRNVL